MKHSKILILLSLAASVFAAVPALADSWENDTRKPRIVREAERRERERQDSTWTHRHLTARRCVTYSRICRRSYLTTNL